MFIFLFLCSLLVPLSMTFLGYTWKDNPPKDRQGISGYRTTMSRINVETWKYAHKCWGSINFVLGIILAILSIFVLILMKDNTNFEMISVYLVFLQLGIMMLTIIPTEFLLHKHFTKARSEKIANFCLVKMKNWNWPRCKRGILLVRIARRLAWENAEQWALECLL